MTPLDFHWSLTPVHRSILRQSCLILSLYRSPLRFPSRPSPPTPPPRRSYEVFGLTSPTGRLPSSILGTVYSGYLLFRLSPERGRINGERFPLTLNDLKSLFRNYRSYKILGECKESQLFLFIIVSFRAPLVEGLQRDVSDLITYETCVTYDSLVTNCLL